jgi:hypothetical protein
MQTYIGGVSCPYICTRRLNHVYISGKIKIKTKFVSRRRRRRIRRENVGEDRITAEAISKRK